MDGLTKELQILLSDSPKCSIIITGHSKGAGMAILSAPFIKIALKNIRISGDLVCLHFLLHG